MNTERDKFLTEAMGGCWHVSDFVVNPFHFPESTCSKCGGNWRDSHNTDFSTWEGFGKLWEWSKNQKLWADFIDYSFDITDWNFSWIDPDKFADAVYNFLSKMEN